MNPIMKSWFEDLDRRDDPLSLNCLAGALSNLPFDCAHFASAVRFDAETYARIRLYSGLRYQALLLCWEPGQQSPIHNHSGNACAFLILDGVARETRFRLNASGDALPLPSEILVAGSVATAYDEDIHRLENAGNTRMTSLHLYSPGLDLVDTFSDRGAAMSSAL